MNKIFYVVSSVKQEQTYSILYWVFGHEVHVVCKIRCSIFFCYHLGLTDVSGIFLNAILQATLETEKNGEKTKQKENLVMNLLSLEEKQDLVEHLSW